MDDVRNQPDDPIASCLDAPEVTPLERETALRLRTATGWWKGDPNALKVLRKFATEGCRGAELSMSNTPISSAFMRWFNLQWGAKAPMTDDQYIKLKNDTIPTLQSQLREANDALARMERYNLAKQYALYAWCARDPKPTK